MVSGKRAMSSGRHQPDINERWSWVFSCDVYPELGTLPQRNNMHPPSTGHGVLLKLGCHSGYCGVHCLGQPTHSGLRDSSWPETELDRLQLATETPDSGPDFGFIESPAPLLSWIKRNGNGLREMDTQGGNATQREVSGNSAPRGKRDTSASRLQLRGSVPSQDHCVLHCDLQYHYLAPAFQLEGSSWTSVAITLFAGLNPSLNSGTWSKDSPNE